MTSMVAVSLDRYVSDWTRRVSDLASRTVRQPQDTDIRPLHSLVYLPNKVEVVRGGGSNVQSLWWDGRRGT